MTSGTRPPPLRVAAIAVVVVSAVVLGGLALVSTGSERDAIPLADLPPTPVASWRGPSRPPADCPKFMAKGPDLFDMRRIGDPSTLDMEVYDRTVVQVGTERIALRSISYISYEMDGCELRPIELLYTVELKRGGHLFLERGTLEHN